MLRYRNRHECKFVVPESVADRVRRIVAPFVRLDGHAERSPDRSYPIASLYLDDAQHSLCRETLEGQAQRYKLRVRAYSDDLNAPVFLEVKRRCVGVVQKLRAPVPRALLADLLEGRRATVPGATALQGEAVAEFLRLATLRRASPCAIVRYQREAWVGLDDDELRVTFDRRLCAVAEHRPRVAVHDPRLVTVPSGGVVLELKFTDRCPSWMQQVIRSGELRRTSFSKYARSMQALAPDRAAAT